jgi:two-component system phosphate regulon sensor histidine kinase PhoR
MKIKLARFGLLCGLAAVSSALGAAALFGVTPSGAGGDYFVLRLVFALICAFAAGAVLIGVMTVSFAEKLVKPLNEMDLDQPETTDGCDELARLFLRVKERNIQMEAKIAASRRDAAAFSAITANMREGLIIVDGDGAVLTCNAGALALLSPAGGGASPVGRSVLSICRDPAFSAAVSEAQSGRAAEARLETESGILSLFISPVIDGGVNAGAAAVIVDVTEREERERLRREFSANVSHELKTPLSAISGFAEIISAGIAGPEDAACFAGKIYGESQKLIRLIDDIIILSNLDERKETHASETVMLSEAAEEAAERLKSKADEKGVSVSLSFESGGEVSGVKTAIYQMVFNIIDNAVTYNVEGGHVNVTVKDEDGGVSIVVNDTGVGIPPGERERVFERFYRIDKSRSLNSGGTGLGLSIVKHAARLHRARVSVSDGESGGTVIKVTFPEDSGARRI